MLDLKNKNTKKQVDEFARCLAKLEPQEFIGVCRLMNVPTVTQEIGEDGKETVEARPADQMVNDLLAKFMEYNRERRRNLMIILRAATRKK